MFGDLEAGDADWGSHAGGEEGEEGGAVGGGGEGGDDYFAGGGEDCWLGCWGFAVGGRWGWFLVCGSWVAVGGRWSLVGHGGSGEGDGDDVCVA
jgi:hypothetical protein